MGRLIHDHQAGYFKHIEEDITEEVKDGRLEFGTAEAPKLSQINYKLLSLEQKQEKIRGNLKYKAVIGKGLIRRNIRQVRKDRLIFPGEKTVWDEGGRKRRIFFKETMREQANERDYRNVLNAREKARFRNRTIRGKVYQTGHKLIDDKTFQDDEGAAEWKNAGRKTFRGTRGIIERNIRSIKLNNNNYARLKYMGNQQQLLQMKKERILNKSMRADYKGKISSAASQYQKRKLKKEMASAIRLNEGNRFKRLKTGFVRKKKSVEQTVRMTKRILSTILSATTLLLLALLLLLFGGIVIMAFMTGGADYMENAVTKNDYHTLSESTAYLQKLETDLEEYLMDKTALERELERIHGPDLYEFEYEIADFGFHSTTLMAYLSAKYGTFTLDEVRAELEELFQEMYTLEIDVQEEIREVVTIDPDSGGEVRTEELKKICYVKLVKKELEEVIDGRMTEEEKEHYGNYKLSSGGQQVYGPVMVEDWTNLISSNFGERIHPITGQRTFHNGVDVAVPTGTKLYSAVNGTVTVAQYSETAGNYIRVQTESGWVVTFMHMDTLAVSAGQKIERGDFVGHSGNTGRSTGPHLHLEVRDSNNNPINPIFIVPQNCYMEEKNDT